MPNKNWGKLNIHVRCAIKKAWKFLECPFPLHCRRRHRNCRFSPYLCEASVFVGGVKPVDDGITDGVESRSVHVSCLVPSFNSMLGVNEWSSMMGCNIEMKVFEEFYASHQSNSVASVCGRHDFATLQAFTEVSTKFIITDWENLAIVIDFLNRERRAGMQIIDRISVFLGFHVY